MDEQLLVLHLGSNMGKRFNYLDTALGLLENEFGKPLKTSAIYQTQAWGNTDQNDFLNLAVIYKTIISPGEVLKLVKNIEVRTGRKPREHWHQREADIDIIFYGGKIIKEPDLIIPHVQMQNRRFVLVPLNEICPEFIHPVFELNVSQLLEQCTDSLTVEKWIKA